MSAECVGKSAKSIQNSPNCPFSLASLSKPKDRLGKKTLIKPSIFRRSNTNKVRSASRVLFKENDRSRVNSQEKVKKSTTFMSITVLTENNLVYNLSNDETHCAQASLLHQTTDSLSHFEVSPRNSETSVLGVGNSGSYSKLKSSPIRNLITTYDQVMLLDFDSAFHRFKSLKHEVLSKKLWKLSFLKKIRRCWTHNKLEDENLDCAERLIKFAFTKYNANDFFHLSLVNSVQEIVKNLTNRPTYEISMKKIDCKYPLMALLNLLFFHDFFKTQLESLIQKCACPKKALKVLFWVSDAAIIALRREKLNRVINHCGKCFEAFCFFFAGLVIQIKETGDKLLGYSKRKRFYKKILKNISGTVLDTVKLAEELYE